VEAAEIAEPLLQYLRNALGEPRLSFGLRPSRISGGNETDIFGLQLRDAPEPFDRPLVARMFRAGCGAARARLEAAAHQAVTEQGLAAPKVFLIGDGLDGVGGSFLIMEHARGRSAVELMHPSLLARLPSLLAETMVALHRLDSAFLLTAAEAAGLDRRSVMLDLSAETRERRAAREFPSLAALGAWLDDHRPGISSSAINHGDLHPFNLMIDHGRVSSVLDWTRAVIAPREYDIAANRIIVNYGPVVGPGPLRSLVPLYRRWFPGRFEAIYRTHLPFDESLVRYFEVQRALGILTDVALRRRAMATNAVVPPDRDKSAKALDGPNLPRLVAHVERLAGLRVELPPRVGPDVAGHSGRARR
jgi:aminoglycoside phosphotransferase (APT) family kinase protein